MDEDLTRKILDGLAAEDQARKLFDLNRSRANALLVEAVGLHGYAKVAEAIGMNRGTLHRRISPHRK